MKLIENNDFFYARCRDLRAVNAKENSSSADTV